MKLNFAACEISEYWILDTIIESLRVSKFIIIELAPFKKLSAIAVIVKLIIFCRTTFHTKLIFKY
jgi:hypothetical protein